MTEDDGDTPFHVDLLDVRRNGQLTARVRLLSRDTDEVLHEASGAVGDAKWQKQFAADAARSLGGGGKAKDVLALLQSHAKAIRDGIDMISAADLINANPQLRDAVIESIARTGDVVNIVGASKTRKSWAALALLMCTVSGRTWLNTFATSPGEALLIDNELHKTDVAFRLRQIGSAMCIQKSEYGSRLKVWSLRGHLMDVHKLCAKLEKLKPGQFKLIVIDSLYRALPDGSNENDNAQGTAIYNRLAVVAEKLGAVVVVVMHSSKGAQGGKSITDVGAGASAYARAADAHVIMREHTEEDCVVMQVANRSFAPVKPLGLRWKFPQWTVDDSLDVKSLKTDRKSGGRPPKPEKEKLSPKEFASRFITADGQIIDQIITSAGDAGIGERESRRLLSVAVQEKHAFEWAFGPKTKTQYANRQNETPLFHDFSPEKPHKTPGKGGRK